MDTWIQLFKSGAYKGRNYRDDDLVRIVERSKGYPIPIRDGGHQQSAPEIGTIGELAVRDGAIFGRVEGMKAEDRKRISADDYSGISIGLRDGGGIDHVALLAAGKTPSVTGMAHPAESLQAGHNLTEVAAENFYQEMQEGRKLVQEVGSHRHG